MTSRKVKRGVKCSNLGHNCKSHYVVRNLDGNSKIEIYLSNVTETCFLEMLRYSGMEPSVLTG